MRTSNRRTTWVQLALTAGMALGAASCGRDKPATSADAGTGGAGGTGGVGGAGGTGTATGGVGGRGVAQKLIILHTNDIHSHFMAQGPERDYTPAITGDDATVGGLARMASAIGAAKMAAAAVGTPVLLLDAGDFEMGTLFELLATQAVPELKFMQAMGYDATTLGNHELDWTPRGLAGILQAAATVQATVPILSSNMVWSATDPGDDDLKALATAGALRTKLVKTVGGLKIGFFGLLGKDAVQVTPQVAPLTFEPIDVAATRMVTELRDVDKVDLVIALSHSGIDAAGKGEDADLAAKVPGIDVIVSGHTHDKLMQPAKVGKTLSVTAGSYGQFLGNLQLSVTPAATAGGAPTVVVDGYTLQSIDDTVAGNAATQAQIDAFIAGLDTVLAPSQLSYKKVVAKTAADLTLPAYAEAPVGNLVTDAYRTVGATLQPTDPPVIAVEGNGQLRSPILKGKTGEIWFADLFRVTPIGIGPNQQPGYPLVTFYLNAKDIRSGLELGAAMELVPDQYFLQVSGVKVEYDMAKPPFGRVSSLKLVSGTTETALDLANTTTCYKIIATNYVAGLLGVVNSFTQGLLSVVAKDSNCTTPVDPTTRFVDADPTVAGVQELKHWQAVLSYVGKLPPDGAGVPAIPAAYATAQGRITKK
ncbi:MAG: bifunctional metallophosphatase/5'-nucleotidase [Pseudomonadota bacterium]